MGQSLSKTATATARTTIQSQSLATSIHVLLFPMVFQILSSANAVKAFQGCLFQMRNTKYSSSSERFFHFQELLFFEHSLNTLHPPLLFHDERNIVVPPDHHYIATPNEPQPHNGDTAAEAAAAPTAPAPVDIAASSFQSSLSNLLAPLPKEEYQDPRTVELEVEVLMDVSHLFLDFSVFVTESKPILNQAQVVGRLLLLLQDYIPDKHISPEELGIQIFMIAVCLPKRQ